MAFAVAVQSVDPSETVRGQTGVDGRLLPVFRDDAAEFARQYGVRDAAAFLVRPDGYLAARMSPPAAPGTASALSAALGRVFRL
jgi:hypothetical protein